MKNLKMRLSEAVSAILGEMGAEISPCDVYSLIEYPPDPKMGDLALPCFRFAKALRKAPQMIAQSVAEKLSVDGIIAVEVAGGYVNSHIDPTYLGSVILPEILDKKENYGRSDIGKGKTVVLDYSSPNICKPFHIGHLGTTVIGHSIKKMHEFCGYNCVGINYLGDWGTQFGKLIVAYKKWGNKDAVDQNGVDELVDLYVRINNEIDGDPENGIPANTALADEARAEFKKLEMGDRENLDLRNWFKEISMREYQKTYDQLGITFDSYKGESFYTDKMPAQVEKIREMGLLKIDDGASIVDLSEYKMPPCLILKRDGTTLYPTRDIAAAVDRKEEYDFDKCIYVTSNQQSLHFKQWFKVVELMGYDWHDKLVHVPYGTISVAGVKLSTRHGNVLLLRDVFAQAIDKVRAVIDEKNPDLENKEETAEAVGVGAIIFHYLLGGIGKDSSFIMDDALSFDGNTGPYAQYTYARTCSVLEKAGEPATDECILTNGIEGNLVKVLAKYGETVEKALNEYEPSGITRYILDVCAAFNRFYHECSIMNAENEVIKATRIKLVKATNYVLGSALPLICLKTPEKV